MKSMELAEPYKIKAIEFVRKTTREERERLIKEVGYNVFALRSGDIFIDLLTDSGTGAMSDSQWAGLMMGDESYAGSRSFYNMRDAVREVMGYEHVLPTHQGRGAEQVLDHVLVKEGDAIPGNIHFDTTKAHIEFRKASAVDCTIDEAYDPTLIHPFKGNLDIGKLRAAIEKSGRERIPYILITVTCNSGGGQPVSVANIREVSGVAKEYGIPLFLDAARFSENAYFIKQREDEFRSATIQEIVLAMTGPTDGCTMSAKKDANVNMGGFIAMRDEELYKKCATTGVLFEGFPTYGGLSGRDMEAIAVGMRESVREDWLTSRIRQTRYLGERLKENGVPILEPIGGHAVYVDVKRFLPHIPQEQYPGMALCAELYVEAGVRGVEIGTVLEGRDPVTGKNRPPRLELMRLTIPRRTYTYNHMDVVVEALTNVYRRRHGIRGFEFDYEPPLLRHFTATFRPLKDSNNE